jgi:hypothetical protein
VPNVRQVLSVAVFIVPLALAACGDHDDVDVAKGGKADNVKFVGRDSNRVAGPNDVQITSSDSAVDLAIIGDTVVAGLGDKVINKVRDKTDTTKVSGNGFAAGIEKMVKSTVADAMSHQVLIPVSEINDVRYEDGGLRFYGKNGSKMHVFENSRNGKGGTSAFNEADAQRFITVFKERKAHTG